MDVSVIVPCRNAGRFAPKMSAMLAAQDFAGTWEALFVDDSDPESAQWRGAAESAGMRVVPSRGRGASAARNTALGIARGEVVHFVDVDDEIPPDYLSRMFAAADGVDFAWGDAEVVTEGRPPRPTRADGPGPAVGDVLEGGAVRDFVWRKCFGYRLRDLPKAILHGGLWRRCGRELGSVCWRAFRRSVVGDLRFAEGLRNGEDSVFLCAFAQRARTMRVAGPTGYRYLSRSDGSLASENADAGLKLEGKFALRDARRELDPSMSRWRGTFVLSVLETLRLGGPAAAFRYLCGRPLVRADARCRAKYGKICI